MLYTIGDEIHVLEEKNNMYFIKRYTITNIIHNKYYELFDGEKKDTVSIYSNNIFKNCDNAFNERDKRIREKQKHYTKIKPNKPIKTNPQKQNKKTIKNPYTDEEIKELAYRIHRRILKQSTKPIQKSHSTPKNNYGLKNPREKRIVEYKPPKRRYNPRYDGDVRIRPVNEGIGKRIRVIKNASGVVIKIEEY